MTALLVCLWFNVHSQSSTDKAAVNHSNSTEKNDTLVKPDSIAGQYKSTLAGKSAWHFNDYYKLKKSLSDSAKFIEQWKKFDELITKYEVERKDSEIKLLQREKQLQETIILQAKYTRNWILGGVALLLISLGLLVNNTRLKQQTNKKLETQQRAIEEQNLTLRHLVNEKDWLVKEIHHRVKNNLQTVMGLLGTQSGYLRNDEAKNAISDSQRRIQAMSLIHQRLYQSNNLSAIKMTDYIHELVDSLSDSFNVSNHIRFQLEIEPIKLDLAHCIPLGLILNEAITNSFKYALEEGREGVISISLRNIAEKTLLLTIKDNGAGLPPGFDVDRSDSMGMNLMRGLSAEIGAQFILSNQNGVMIEVTFKYDPDIPIDITQTKTEKAYSL